MSDEVLVTREGHVLVATINRPEARNAVNLAVATGLGAALEQAQHDPEVRVLVVTGAGDRSFCAGQDLKALARGERSTEAGRERWGFAGYVRHFIDKPTVAAVNGAALGGGTEIALASDLAVAAASATFGLPEVKRGLVAGAGGAFRLARQLPRKLANEVLLTGEPVTAETAAGWGLVNRVVPDGEVLAAALELAQRIAANAPLSVQASKRISYAAHDGEPGGEAELWRVSLAESAAVMRSEDAKEGPRAFAERRPAEWTGR